MKKILIASFIILFLVLTFYIIGIRATTSKNEKLLKENTNLNLTSKDELQIEDFQIGGMKLEQSISQVEKVLGKPKKKYESKKNEFETYEYDGIEIEFGIKSKNILYIVVERKGLKTFRGISVGDKEANVIHRYGKTEKLNGEDLNYQMYVSRDYLDYNYALNFTIKDKKVAKIMVYFAGD